MKTIVLTGASDGIGAAAARQLARNGNRLLLAGRSEAKLRAVAEATGVEEYFAADFEKLDEVRRLAREIRAATDRIDVLANNAGGLYAGPVITSDGFERTFQVDYLAAFLLTHELMDILLASGAAVVNTSSVAARVFGRLDMDDVESRRRFSTRRAYGNGKLACFLHARGLHARFHARGLSAMAFHPGNVAGTGFGWRADNWLRVMRTAPARLVMMSPKEGGANLAHFAGGRPGETWESDQFYGPKRRIVRTHKQAYDPEVVQRFWEKTCDMLGIAES